MRAILSALRSAAAIALYLAAASAASAGMAVPQNATPLPHFTPVGYDYGGYAWGGYPWGGYPLGGYVYRPACPYGYHYDCRYDPFGYRRCACWPNF